MNYIYPIVRAVSFVFVFAVLLMNTGAENGRSIDVLVYLCVLPVWFGPTLLLQAIHGVQKQGRLLRTLLFGSMDTYLLLMGFAAIGFSRPYALAWGLVFLYAAFRGLWVGAVAAIAGALGVVNGWLIPRDQLGQFFMAVIAVAIAYLFGVAWHVVIPLLRSRMLPASVESSVPEEPVAMIDDDDVQIMRDQLSQMESRLQAISEEREMAEERAGMLEEQVERLRKQAEGSEGTEANEGSDERVAALEAERDKLKAEVEQLSTELMAAYAGGDEGTGDAGGADAGQLAEVEAERDKLKAEVEQLSTELMAAYAGGDEGSGDAEGADAGQLAEVEAERDKLKAEVEQLSTELMAAYAGGDESSGDAGGADAEQLAEVVAERDKLKAEVEQLSTELMAAYAGGDEAGAT